MDADGPWLTVAQAAAHLGVSPSKTRELADAGRLDDPEPVWRVGAHRRISQKSAERLRRELRGQDPDSSEGASSS